MFGEEVVRGGPAFAVSLAITAIEPTLRNSAALGAWQVISPQDVRGIVEVVDDLSSVQEKTYETPTVLIANQVSCCCHPVMLWGTVLMWGCHGSSC